MNIRIFHTTLILALFFSGHIFTQNVGINANGVAPNVSAMLDIDVSSLATKTGLLIPRLTLVEKTAMNPLPAAAQGLIVYQTNGIEGFYYNTSITTTPNWIYLLPSSSSGAGWTITGNAGSTASSAVYGASVNNNFIGTTDNIDFVFATNNLERMRITNKGSIGIGTSAPFASDFIDINPSGMTGTTQWGVYVTMPSSGANASIGFRLDNNSASQTGNKTGIWSQVGGNDATANTKRAYYGQATGNAGTVNGGRFEAIGTGVTDNYGVYGYASGSATNNYAIYGEINTAATNNYALALKNGHMKSIQTTAPTVASVVTYVLGSQSLSNATDIAGNLTIVTTAAAGSITIQFNKAYAVAPIVNITPTSTNAAIDLNKLYITTTTTGFTLNFSASPSANTKTYNYFVIETQ